MLGYNANGAYSPTHMFTSSAVISYQTEIPHSRQRLRIVMHDVWRHVNKPSRYSEASAEILKTNSQRLFLSLALKRSGPRKGITMEIVIKDGISFASSSQ